jgi:hypothetical protein
VLGRAPPAIKVGLVLERLPLGLHTRDGGAVGERDVVRVELKRHTRQNTRERERMAYEGVIGGLLRGDANRGDVGAEDGPLLLLPHLLVLGRRLLLRLRLVGRRRRGWLRLGLVPLCPPPR